MELTCEQEVNLWMFIGFLVGLASMWFIGKYLMKPDTNTKPNPNFHIYKFRAECEHDVTLFFSSVPVENITSKRIKAVWSFSDRVVVFQSDLSIGELRYYMRLVPDSHVMIQTLSHAHEYTGERNTSIN